MQPGSAFFKFLSIFLVIFFMTPESSQAGRVVKVKGRQVYIKLDPAEVDGIMQGDYLYTTTKNGKKVGIVVIRKMKGRLVIAKLGKGNAKRGMYTTLRKSDPRKQNRPIEAASDIAITEKVEQRSEMRLGVLGSFGTATQNVTGVADMSGSTTGFKGVFDYELFSDFGVRARIGMDMLSVTGTSSGGQTFDTSITYLTIDLLLRYYLLRSESFGIFLNAGMGIYSPMSTDLGTNAALREDSISTTSLLVFGGGFAIPLGSWEIYLGADYLYFPPSEDVDTSVISGKLGLIFEL